MRMFTYRQKGKLFKFNFLTKYPKIAKIEQNILQKMLMEAGVYPTNKKAKRSLIYLLMTFHSPYNN